MKKKRNVDYFDRPSKLRSDCAVGKDRNDDAITVEYRRPGCDELLERLREHHGDRP